MLDRRDIYRETPLHEAAKWGHLAIVKFFITQGADVNVKGTDGRSPIHLAIERGNKDVIELLTRHGAKL